MAADRKAAGTALAVVEKPYGAKYADAVEGPTKDRDALLAFYDFPAEHWDHVRTTNPIASVFATVRHQGHQSHATQRRLITSSPPFRHTSSWPDRWPSWRMRFRERFKRRRYDTVQRADVL
jgi:transposase-like protein